MTEATSAAWKIGTDSSMMLHYYSTYYYNPGRATISSISTIKKIAGPVLTPISQIRGISSSKKRREFCCPFNPYTLHPGSSIFLIVAIDEIVALPGL